MTSITLKDGMLVVRTPYNAELVAEIKALPYSDRKWDAASKSWLVDPSHGNQVAAAIDNHLGIKITPPILSIKGNQIQTKLLEVYYLGQTKDRGDGTYSAFAYLSDGCWGAIFPLEVLKTWFEDGPSIPNEQSSLYAVLAIKPIANIEDINSGYRRMALQWHPDRCKEPDANEQFIRIQEAYNILSNDGKRARYDAGLRLQHMSQLQNKSVDTSHGYRSPLKSGYILCTGTNKLGRFYVENILSWQDVVNSSGQTLVSSWLVGDDKPTLKWV